MNKQALPRGGLGRSATDMTKRPQFLAMLSRVRNQADVDYIIVYQLSRMARNRYDDAIVMADLRKRGVTLISAKESIDDTPVGQLMHGILATFNEYQSRQAGDDIKYKMGQKARNGGTRKSEDATSPWSTTISSTGSKTSWNHGPPPHNVAAATTTTSRGRCSAGHATARAEPSG